MRSGLRDRRRFRHRFARVLFAARVWRWRATVNLRWSATDRERTRLPAGFRLPGYACALRARLTGHVLVDSVLDLLVRLPRVLRYHSWKVRLLRAILLHRRQLRRATVLPC